MLLDTGSSVSLINSRVIGKIPSLFVYTCTTPILKMANGSSMCPIGQTTLSTVYNNAEHNHLFYIYNNLPFDFLLGIDFCKKFNVDIKFSEINQTENNFKTLPFNNYLIEKQNNQKNILTIVHNTLIPANTGKWVEVQSEERLPEQIIFTYNRILNFKSKLIFRDSLQTTDKTLNTQVFVINPTNVSIGVRQFTKIGDYEAIEKKVLFYINEDNPHHSPMNSECEGTEEKGQIPLAVALPLSGAEARAEAGAEARVEAGAEAGAEARAEARAEAGVEARAEAGAEAGAETKAGAEAYAEATAEVRARAKAQNEPNIIDSDFNIGANLSPQEQSEFKRFLDTNSHLFAKSIKDLTRTNVIKHKINTIPHNPIARGPYRCSPKERQAIEKQIEEMLDANIISESNSPYASPVVMVVKASGQLRFCVDYRGINSVTIRDAYPIPRIQGLMTAFNGAKIFSSLDMVSGYWQIPMDENDIDKTSFITHCGTYSFNVAPFGLCTMPETYQRMIDKVIAGLKFHICVAYLDDLVVYAKDFKSHIKNLDRVFSAIEQANLRMNPSKCYFGMDKLKYLGWIVSADGTLPDPSKVAIISEFRDPTSTTEIKQFLGMTGYYQNSIKNYAIKAEPLRRLLRKNVPFIWTTEQTQSVLSLKQALCTAPVRVHYDPDKPIRVQSDASLEGIGYILAHVIDGEEHPFRYGGRSLKDTEENYTITQLEALAFYEAITKNREFLLGVQFEVITDHCALCWILKAEDTCLRINRWIQKLSEYQFIIKYKKGLAHTNADALSRQFKKAIKQAAAEAKAEAEDDVTEYRYVFFNEKLDIAAFQRKDDWCRNLIDQLNNTHNRSTRVGGKIYKIINNVLFRMVDDGNDKLQQLCVPKELRKDILFSLHTERSSAHFGIAKTFDKVRKRCYWPKMYRSVEQYVKTCLDCQTRKPAPGFKYGQGQVMEIPTTPFISIATDLLGRFPKSNNNNQYIIVITDHSTRYVITEAIPNQTAETVAKVLVEKVFLVFGAPERILSDNGRQYCSNLVQEILRLVGTRHVRTTSYHPECNSIVENFNKTLATALSMYCNTSQLNWDDALPYITWAFNTSKNASTQFSPYYLLFGREPRLFIDNVLQLPTNNEYLEDIITRVQDARSLANDFTKDTQYRNKLFYDSKRRISPFKTGDKVMVFTPVRRVGKSEQLLHRVFGPFVIKEVLSPVNVRVESLDKKRGEVIHVGRLKKYFEDNLDNESEECLEPDWIHGFDIQPSVGCNRGIGQQRSISEGQKPNGEPMVSGHPKGNFMSEVLTDVTSSNNGDSQDKINKNCNNEKNSVSPQPVINRIKRKYTRRFLPNTVRKSTRILKKPDRLKY